MDDIVEEDPQNQSKGHSFTDSQIEYSFDNSMSQPRANNSGFMIVNSFASKNEKNFLQKISEENSYSASKEESKELSQVNTKIQKMIEKSKKNFKKSKTLDPDEVPKIEEFHLQIKSAKKKIDSNKSKKSKLNNSMSKKSKKVNLKSKRLSTSINKMKKKANANQTKNEYGDLK